MFLTTRWVRAHPQIHLRLGGKVLGDRILHDLLHGYDGTERGIVSGWPRLDIRQEGFPHDRVDSIGTYHKIKIPDPTSLSFHSHLAAGFVIELVDLRIRENLDTQLTGNLSESVMQMPTEKCSAISHMQSSRSTHIRWTSHHGTPVHRLLSIFAWPRSSPCLLRRFSSSNSTKFSPMAL